MKRDENTHRTIYRQIEYKKLSEAIYTDFENEERAKSRGGGLDKTNRRNDWKGLSDFGKLSYPWIKWRREIHSSFARGIE